MYGGGYAVWMRFDTSGVQTHYIYLDSSDPQLLQMQKHRLKNTLSGPAVHPDINHRPILVFFG